MKITYIIVKRRTDVTLDVLLYLVPINQIVIQRSTIVSRTGSTYVPVYLLNHPY